jgi:diguanylate cyclase
MVSRLLNFVLGPPGRTRVSVMMTLLTLLIYGLVTLLLQVVVHLGLIDRQATRCLIAFAFAGSVVFYLLLRSGLSARISREPSLMLFQNVHSVLAIVWAYAILGPVRGVVLAALVLMVTYGMFALRARQAHMLTLFSVVLLAVTMWWKNLVEPLRYPAQEEAIHLAIAVIVLLGVSALSIRMGALRASLRNQKKELEQSLERIRLLATQDELTGLSNRRHMLDLMKAEQSRQQRTEQPLSLALLDVDHFKRVNDKYGHHAGDAVLKGFADAVSSALRGSDVMSRWGGEEFLLMLPVTGLDEAELCIDRMRQGLAQVSFDSVAPNLKITFSAGVSVCLAGEPLEAAIERADQAMYDAKAQGRNCTVCG